MFRISAPLVTQSLVMGAVVSGSLLLSACGGQASTPAAAPNPTPVKAAAVSAKTAERGDIQEEIGRASALQAIGAVAITLGDPLLVGVAGVGISRRKLKRANTDLAQTARVAAGQSRTKGDALRIRVDSDRASAVADATRVIGWKRRIELQHTAGEADRAR